MRIYTVAAMHNNQYFTCEAVKRTAAATESRTYIQVVASPSSLDTSKWPPQSIAINATSDENGMG